MVAGGVNISARDVTLDSLPMEVRGRIDSVVYHLAGGAQHLRADTIALDTARETVTIGSFALVPGFDKEEFAERSIRHEDWTSIKIDSIACRGVDFAALAADKILAIDSIHLAGADIASYKNRKVHREPRPKTMLYEAIRSLPLPTRIAALTFAGLDITYEELAERGETPGAVTIMNGSGRAENLTNIAAGNDPRMTLEVAAAFMNSGALEARFLFPVDPADDHWELSGRLGHTDMAAFNRVLEPLMDAKIISGTLRSVDFRIEGTGTRSQTHLRMAYQDLKVALLDHADHTRVRRFLTVLADDVLIRPDNPAQGGRMREAETQQTRDPERSMWNYIWRSFLPAILKTVV
jgi:hypothetical protein